MKWLNTLDISVNHHSFLFPVLWPVYCDPNAIKHRISVIYTTKKTDCHTARVSLNKQVKSKPSHHRSHRWGGWFSGPASGHHPPAASSSPTPQLPSSTTYKRPRYWWYCGQKRWKVEKRINLIHFTCWRYNIHRFETSPGAVSMNANRVHEQHV